MIYIKEIDNPSEKETAFEIRRKVFVEEQNVSLEEEYDEFDSTSIHFLAFLGEIPVGTARIRKTTKGIKLERFAVLKEFRRRTVGSNLVNKLLTKCKNDIDSKVYLYAQVSAQLFYEKLEFRPVGEKFLEAGIIHIEMQYVGNR
jgi:predicted GNAT family N-acyltransferase